MSDDPSPDDAYVMEITLINAKGEYLRQDLLWNYKCRRDLQICMWNVLAEYPDTVRVVVDIAIKQGIIYG